MHRHIRDLKDIPPKIVQHKIEFDIIIPLIHQTKYRLNPNYVVIIKQNIYKFIIVSFIKLVEGTTWLSPIVVVLKNNGKLKTYVDFKKFNTTTMKDPYSLPFTGEIVKFCTLLNGF